MVQQKRDGSFTRVTGSGRDDWGVTPGAPGRVGTSLRSSMETRVGVLYKDPRRKEKNSPGFDKEWSNHYIR